MSTEAEGWNISNEWTAQVRNEPLQGWETKSRLTEIKSHKPRCPHCKSVLKKSYTRKWDDKKLKLIHIGFWCKICKQFIYKFGESPHSRKERQKKREAGLL